MDRLFHAHKIDIALDQNVYLAGTKLTGVVHFTSHHDFHARLITATLRVSEHGLGGAEKVWYEDSVIVWRDMRERQAMERRFVVVQEQGTSAGSPAMSDAASSQLLQDRLLLEEESHLLRKGTHTFPFIFQLPTGTPSSFYGNRNFQMRYILRMTVEHLSDATQNVDASREVNVVENLTGVGPSVLAGPTAPVYNQQTLKGANLCVVARTNKDVFMAGEPIFLALYVKNETKQRLSNINCKVRRLVYSNDGSLTGQPFTHPAAWSKYLVKKKTLSHHRYTTHDYETQPFGHRHLLFEVDTPRNACTIDRTSLFRVEWVLHVSFDDMWGSEMKIDLSVRFINPLSQNSIFFPRLYEEMEQIMMQEMLGMDRNNAEVRQRLEAEDRQARIISKAQSQLSLQNGTPVQTPTSTAIRSSEYSGPSVVPVNPQNHGPVVTFIPTQPVTESLLTTQTVTTSVDTVRQVDDVTSQSASGGFAMDVGKGQLSSDSFSRPQNAVVN